ncbi:sigma-54 interaction domain-containing protein [Tepidanaerobacter acetatoxydans]|uniref:sigma-54 interaction domain-containing protein n=1 Tax=Tepidanaerobacter acetatoxydans TaxID=499229 RepID=UPI002F40BDC8
MLLKNKEKTEQFKAVLNHISEGIIAINSNGEITVFNPAAGRIMGISEKEAIGRSIDELVPETILNSVIEKNKAELGQVLRIGQAQVLANRVPIIINNKMVGAVTTIEDITKIQEYEQKIRTKLLVKGQVAKYKFSDIIGESDVLLKTKEKAKKYAATNGTVLIIGESGTGKEMFAQSIHLESERRNGPFVAVNCTAIPQNLLESELFGYQGGAFTGARKEGKSGLFTEAHGGTIFLDEIGEMSTELQVALLRVIQEREVRPVGSNKVIPIDVRIIAATNKDLLQEIQKGAFRRDLYYRLNILKLKVPALRERKEDIKLLSRYFVSKISLKYKKVVSITEGALDRLQRYSWPGNIRELENIIESLIVLADDIITEAQVDELIGENVEEDAENKDSLEIIKNKHILKVLSECGGNQTLAAKRLGISRTHLWRLINNYKK